MKLNSHRFTQIDTDVKDKEKLMSKHNINPLTTITLGTSNLVEQQ